MSIALPAYGQTITVNDATSNNTRGAGVGFYGPNYFNSLYGYQLLTLNPGFQPIVQNEIDIVASGSTTGYTSSDGYVTAAASSGSPVAGSYYGWGYYIACNFGGTATYACDGATGSSGTITANTVGYTGGGSSAIAFTFSSTLSRSLVAGDAIYLIAPAGSTPISQLGPSFGGNGAWSIDTTPGNLPASSVAGLPAPSQCVQLNNPASGSSTIQEGLDGTSGELNYTFSGNYTGDFYAKIISGSNQSVTLSVQRGSNTPIINQTDTINSTSWTHYGFTGSGSETSSTTPTTVLVKWTIVGTGVVDVCSRNLTEATHTNPTVFGDRTFAKLQAMKPGSLRYNLINTAGGGTEGCTLIAMLQPRSQANPCNGSLNANFGGTSITSVPLGLHDFLVLAQALGVGAVEPSVPPTLTATEQANLTAYLGGSTATTYGAIRAALGQSTPWTSVFTKINLDVGNETWNNRFPGMYIGSATFLTYPTFYTLSGAIASRFCGSVESATGYSSVIRCGANVQQDSGQNNQASVARVDPSGYVKTLNSSDYYITGTASATSAGITDCTPPSLYADLVAEASVYNVTDTTSQMYENLSTATPYTLGVYGADWNAYNGNCSTAQIVGIADDGFMHALVTPLMYQYQMAYFPGVIDEWNYWEFAGLNRTFYGIYPLSYSTSVNYPIGTVTTSGFTSIQNTNTNNPTSDTAHWLPVAYSGGNTYPQYAVVSSGGSYYQSQINGNIGNAVTTTSAWLPIANSQAGWGAYAGAGGQYIYTRPVVYSMAMANTCMNLGVQHSVSTSGPQRSQSLRET